METGKVGVEIVPLDRSVQSEAELASKNLNSSVGQKKLGQKVLSKSESEFLSYLRSFSIFIIVFGHVGGFLAFKPYSEFLHVFVPVFFFISGAVLFNSYNRSPTTLIYYKKRFVGLLVPYYLLCILSLFVFILTKQEIPTFNILNLLRWIQIRPSSNIMPFPVGQVWFLHTLFIIVLISPLYFKIYNKNAYALYAIMLFLVGFSVTPLLLNISKHLYFLGNNLYKPLIHSSFFIFGILSFSSSSLKKTNVLIYVFVFGILTSVITAYSLNLNIDYTFHTFSPDIYYVSGSFSAISLIFLSRGVLLKFIKANFLLKLTFNFFHKHTFSIYLLHSFSISLSENIFGLVNTNKKITLGLIKLIVVLIITCLLSIPYTKISKKISAALLFTR